MLVIPERNLLVIQPPRTGSTSLKVALLERYPKAKSLFRHMERGGIPEAYRDYDVACVIRHPLARLHSLWRYMRIQRPEDHSDKNWAIRVAKDSSRPFADWLRHSREPFTTRPRSDIANPGYYDVLDEAPATRKSLRAWARPDLGPVEILKLENIEAIENRLDVKLPHLNAATPIEMATMDRAAKDVIETYHHWDLEHYATMPASTGAALETLT